MRYTKISSLLLSVAMLAVNTSSYAANEGEMKVTLLGTGTPIININRFGMSTLVEAGKHSLLFDAGRGAVIRLHQIQKPLRDIDAVFFTHMHSDHLTGFSDLYATAPLPTDDGKRKVPFKVYGPKGVEAFTSGISFAFQANNDIRMKQGEFPAAATKVDTTVMPDEGGVIYDKDGIKVTAFLVDHGDAKPAYGYRVDYAGHSVVLSGDTSYSPNLIKNAKQADLLIHSLSVGSHQLEQAHPDYVNFFYSFLANPESVGKVLNQTQPKDAVISHISLYSKGEIPRASEVEINQRIQKVYKGKYILGQDLMSFIINNDGVTRLPYNPTIRQYEPIK